MNGVNSQKKLNKAAPEQGTRRKGLLTHYNELLKITDGRKFLGLAKVYEGKMGSWTILAGKEYSNL